MLDKIVSDAGKRNSRLSYVRPKFGGTSGAQFKKLSSLKKLISNH